MTRPRAILLVRRLRLLSARAGTADEAATAARRAFELCQRHKISEEDLAEKEQRTPKPAPTWNVEGKQRRVGPQRANAYQDAMFKALRKTALQMEEDFGFSGIWQVLEPTLRRSLCT